MTFIYGMFLFQFSELVLYMVNVENFSEKMSLYAIVRTEIFSSLCFQWIIGFDHRSTAKTILLILPEKKATISRNMMEFVS